MMNNDRTEQDIDEDSRWRIIQKHFFMQNNAKVNCASYHANSNVLVVGFSNGLFGLYELPDFNMIHTLRFVLSHASRTLLIYLRTVYLKTISILFPSMRQENGWRSGRLNWVNFSFGNGNQNHIF
jgi:hypothetical protein